MEAGEGLRPRGPAPGQALAGALRELDWERPWYRPFAGAGRAVAGAVAAGEPLHRALDAQGRGPVRFVPQSELPGGMAYEAHIFGQGACPTRENLHDFFNGLVWLRLPACKRQLNRIQAGEIARNGVGGVRGPVRDAVTLLDENGALLDAPQPLWDALVARNWRRAFVDLRGAWAGARLVLMGHALLEQLAAPRRNLTAHVLRMPVDLGDVAAADAALAPRLQPAALAAKPFTPLPVMGIPGWCADNQNFSFYDDSSVFRPSRS